RMWGGQRHLGSPTPPGSGRPASALAAGGERADRRRTRARGGGSCAANAATVGSGLCRETELCVVPSQLRGRTDAANGAEAASGGGPGGARRRGDEDVPPAALRDRGRPCGSGGGDVRSGERQLLADGGARGAAAGRSGNGDLGGAHRSMAARGRALDD